MRIFDIWLAYRISFYCFILIGWMLMPIMKNHFFFCSLYYIAFEIDDKGMKIHPLYNNFLWSHDMASNNQHHGMYLSYNIHIAINDTLHFISTDERETHHCDHHKITRHKCSCVTCRKQKKCFLSRGRTFQFTIFFPSSSSLYSLGCLFFLHFRIVAAF